MMFQSLARGKPGAGCSCPSVLAVTSLTEHISFVDVTEGSILRYMTPASFSSWFPCLTEDSSHSLKRWMPRWTVPPFPRIHHLPLWELAILSSFSYAMIHQLLILLLWRYTAHV